MIEDVIEASERPVSRETLEKLHRFVELLVEENARQNLISRSTLDSLWQRHIFDSAQLLRFAPEKASWVDIGSGAGLPGIVIAILSHQPIALVEPRRLRADFLQRVVVDLGLREATVHCAKVERISGSFDVITARAVAPVGTIFAISRHLSHPGTRWVLPKGRSGAKELAEAERAWQGRFRTEPSITEGDAVILLAEGVKPRGGTR